MLLRSALLAALLPLPLAGLVAAQGPAPDEAIDERAVEVLRRHGLEQSQVMEILSWICDVHGPRLTGSPNLRRAQDWAVETLRGWGVENPHLEEWGPFGVGWQLDGFRLEVVGDNPWPVLAWPKAWSPSVEGRIEADAVYVAELSAEALDALDLTGKIVLVQEPREISEPFEAPSERLEPEDLLRLANGTRSAPRPSRPERRESSSTPARQENPGAPAREENPTVRALQEGEFRQNFARRGAVLEKVWAKRPLAIVDRGSKGDYGTVFVQGASAPPAPRAEGSDGEARASRRVWDPGVAGVVPQLTMAVEHYNRICRLLAKGLPVRLGLELQAKFFDQGLMERNVIAELPGTDPQIGTEVVMLGAHFDSWHSGTGATDNGCGSAVMMEAMRLLRQLVTETGQGPRRTIRIGLWSGEEQGLRGSRAYVEQHFGGRGAPTSEHATLSGYFNLDNGTGRIRGVYLQGNAAVAPIFRTWLQPFHDLEAATLSLGNTGGTDHLAFDGVGLPGFQFIQDPVSYSPKTHHSNMDNWDHAVAEDLKQAATIIASFAWHAAQRDEMLPRKPLPAPPSPEEEGARRR